MFFITSSRCFDRLRRTRTGTSILGIPAFVILAMILLIPAVRQSGADENRYDIMRLVTTQWIKPYMYLVLDRSGSMHMTLDQGYNSSYRWYFEYDSSIEGYITLEDDWTDNSYRGHGQGFWLRVGTMRVINEPPTSWTYDGYTWSTGWADHDYPHNIYSNQTEAAISEGELIEIINYPIDGVNGIYLCAANSNNSSHNPGWRYTRFFKMRPDGTFEDSTYTFPLYPGSGDAQDVKPFTFRRVTLTTDPWTLTNSGDSSYSRMNDGARDLLYIDEDLEVKPGDIVRITGFSYSSNNGVFFIREYVSNGSGYDRFRVSKMNASGNFPNTEFSFSGPDDFGATAEIMWLDYRPNTIWYFVGATRIAIAKNVWGTAVTVYEPSIAPSGTDSEGKDYYIFDGPGPVNGAWLEWEDSGDNGGGKTWHNWSSSSGAPPAGDPAYTTEQAPSEMVRRFGDVAHLGLILYSGGCPSSYFTPAVELDTGSPASVVAPIEAMFETRADGGIVPGGSTPTRMAIASGGHHIEEAYDADQQKGCGRTYGVLLMTDGLSNNCNPSNGSWSSCPSNYTSYPAGISDNLWKTKVDGVDLKIRTWALGISKEVGRCELNYTAYKGRTDASSPNGDAGFSIDDDPYLTEGDTDVYDTAHGDYAFFANSVDELRQALLDIIASMGVGDYATASPSIGSGGGTVIGSIALNGSSEYPSWEGHLRAYDLCTDPMCAPADGVYDEDYQIWDAAEVLKDTSNPNNGFTRRIFTWDPTDSNSLVAIAPGTSSTLDGICNSCGITDEVVDFILGNDGNILPGHTTGTMRPKQLGAVIHTTPAVLGPPTRFEQNQLHEHSSFEATYSDRHTLVWVGTSDGSVSAFDIVDGAEVLRVIPPDLLEKQVELYGNYSANPAKNPLGQSGLPADHIFGVANSVRFGDVWDSSMGEYRTVMFIAEGPGGNGIHAIDVTHPFPGRDDVTRNPPFSAAVTKDYPTDPNYGYGETGNPPFKVLWSKTADGSVGTETLVGLGAETWAVPALGATDAEDWILQVPAGYNVNTGNASNPKVFFFDPVTGDPFLGGSLAESTISLSNAGSPYVPNNAFANAVVWQDDSNRFRADNLANEGVQTDLNGHLWSVKSNGVSISKTALMTISDASPLYFSPAVAGYPYYPVEYSLYAFSTGSFYAMNEDVSGADVGTAGHFIPKLYIAVKELATGTMTSMNIDINDLPKPGSATETLGTNTQVIAPPMIFVPDADSAADPFALFLVYDPLGATCVGVSYIVRINFNPANLSEQSTATYEAGEGVSGGIVLAGENVIVSQSGVGEGEDARLVVVPDLNIPIGADAADVTWWIELQ